MILLSFVSSIGVAQTIPVKSHEFPRGSLKSVDQLPAGRLRTQIKLLPPTAQERAVRWLGDIHFTTEDLAAMHADKDGGIYFVCDLVVPATSNTETPVTSQAAVPVSPFPAALMFHSRPGAANVLFLNFCGESVSGTAWNASVGRDPIPAVPFSTDSDFTTFSDAEQLAIKRIWQRVAEDYAPFDVDVTTERPASFNSRVANVLVTRNTDANGAANPSSSAGGVAYVNVFAGSSYSNYRPAWVYFNNLASTESYIAEAASHEAGHNFGLSHDGTSGSAYYGGHGSGDISWGPIMGTGYNRNVSQWCKGEYYDANNTEDDLAILSGKMTYRTDDVGNTSAAATPLVVTSGTNIVSTTPENDPDDNNPANKGVIERNTDVDVFSFNTGSGPVNLVVNPWVEPSGNTRGGNLDVSLELRDFSNNVLATNNPSAVTGASIQTNLPAGTYYLYVKNTGVGDPLSSSPWGYTSYGTIGQYFISGYLTATTNLNAPPQAQLAAGDLTQSEQGPWQFTVTYSDDTAVNVATIDGNDVRVAGPNGYDRTAQLVSVNPTGNGTPRTATYAAIPPDSNAWINANNGSYAVYVLSNEVADVDGTFVPASQLGQFTVNVPVELLTLYSADMDSNPGWALEGGWQYGAPAYTAQSCPVAGYTGTNIMGYNLAGNYPDNLSAKYATTPAINCSGSTVVTLRFERWLKLKNGDTAMIQASTNGTDWVNVWSTSSSLNDTSWQSVQYDLPRGMAGNPAVRIRWGLASNNSQNNIGWNLDDLAVLGDGLPATNETQFTLSITTTPVGAGVVNAAAGIYPAGTVLQAVATPAAYYHFDAWTGDVSGTNNPVMIVLNSNVNAVAHFAEIMTTNHPTPEWWLAGYGFTNNFEFVVDQIGANGCTLWQSYVAGLDPTDVASRFLVSGSTGLDGTNFVLNWNTVTGRVYSVWSATSITGPFAPVPEATNLPWTTPVFTNQLDGTTGARYYRVEVSLP